MSLDPDKHPLVVAAKKRVDAAKRVVQHAHPDRGGDHGRSVAANAELKAAKAAYTQARDRAAIEIGNAHAKNTAAARAAKQQAATAAAEQAERARQAEQWARGAAERARQAEQAAAERVRQAEQAAAERVRQAEQAAAERVRQLAAKDAAARAENTRLWVRGKLPPAAQAGFTKFFTEGARKGNLEFAAVLAARAAFESGQSKRRARTASA